MHHSATLYTDLLPGDLRQLLLCFTETNPDYVYYDQFNRATVSTTGVIVTFSWASAWDITQDINGPACTVSIINAEGTADASSFMTSYLWARWDPSLQVPCIRSSLVKERLLRGHAKRKANKNKKNKPCHAPA